MFQEKNSYFLLIFLWASSPQTGYFNVARLWASSPSVFLSPDCNHKQSWSDCASPRSKNVVLRSNNTRMFRSSFILSEIWNCWNYCEVGPAQPQLVPTLTHMYREKGTVATTSNNDKTDISIEHTPPPAPASPTNISINPLCQGGRGVNKFQKKMLKNVTKYYQMVTNVNKF